MPAVWSFISYAKISLRRFHRIYIDKGTAMLMLKIKISYQVTKEFFIGKVIHVHPLSELRKKKLHCIMTL